MNILTLLGCFRRKTAKFSVKNANHQTGRLLPMENMIQLIKKHEGFKPSVYKCSEGFDTIGIGFKVDNLYLTESICDQILELKIVKILDKLEKRASWVQSMPETIQSVVINMSYQMGVSGFLRFKKTIDLLKQRKWTDASVEMLDSLWAKQTPNRSRELSEMVGNCE